MNFDSRIIIITWGTHEATGGKHFVPWNLFPTRCQPHQSRIPHPPPFHSRGQPSTVFQCHLLAKQEQLLASYLIPFHSTVYNPYQRIHISRLYIIRQAIFIYEDRQFTCLAPHSLPSHSLEPWKTDFFPFCTLCF
jgi:hypothetical protein